MNESQAVTYKTLIKDASYGEAGPDERTIAACLDLFNRPVSYTHLTLPTIA